MYQQGQETVQGYVLKCPNCGAPLDVSPDDVVTVCKYCGQLVSIREDIKNAFVVEAEGKEDVEKEVFQELKKKGVRPTPMGGKIVYLPFFYFQGHSRGTVAIEKKVGNQVIRSTFHYEKEVPTVVYGRYGEFLGLDRILDKVEKLLDKNKVKIGSVKPDQAQHTQMLGPQKNMDEVLREARERAEFNASPIRAKGVLGSIQAQATGIKFYDAHVSVDYKGLYFFPIFIYTWKEGGRRFVTVADASDGRILLTRLPVSPTIRNVAAGIAILSPLLALLLTHLTSVGAASLIGSIVGVASSMFSMRGEITWPPI